MTFETTDIVLAAYLKAKGYPLLEIVMQGKRGQFVFDDVPVNVISEYDLDAGLCEPKALNQQIRALSTATKR